MGNETPLKERIRRGDIVIGVSASMDATKSQLEDILGKDDYGFVMTDSQHSPFSEHKMVDFCNMADEVGIPVHLRIDHPRHAYSARKPRRSWPRYVGDPPRRRPRYRPRSNRVFLLPARRTTQLRWGQPLGCRARKRHEHVRRVVEQQRHPLHPDRVAPRHREHPSPLSHRVSTCSHGGRQISSGTAKCTPTIPLRLTTIASNMSWTRSTTSTFRMSYRSYDPKLRNKYLDMGVTVLFEQPQT